MGIRAKLPNFSVVVDTNAIFPKTPWILVSPKFSTTWQDCCGLTDLSLIVPEVVRDERLYRLVAWIKEASEAVAGKLKVMNELSGAKFPPMPSAEDFKKGIEEAFTRWAQSLNVVVQPVPFDSIDWKKVVKAAVWRENPFDPPTEEKDSEKGFRDCLILETLDEIVEKTSGRQVVFITNDKRLHNAATARFDSKCLCHEDATAFHSFLKLIEKNANQTFAANLLAKVSQVFFTVGDQDCVWTKFNILDRIKKTWSALLESLIESEAKFQRYTPPTSLYKYDAG
jgi:hypothetical protein